MAETNDNETPKKTTRRKSTPRAPQVDNTALADKLSVAINELRQQLRTGQTVALPGLLEQMLPTGAAKGDRAKVMEWRAYIVWAEWTGEWSLVIIEDGKERK